MYVHIYIYICILALATALATALARAGSIGVHASCDDGLGGACPEASRARRFRALGRGAATSFQLGSSAVAWQSTAGILVFSYLAAICHTKIPQTKIF